MKTLLAGLLLAAFLVPDTAYATYSCFGTRSPCDLSGGIKVSQLDDKPVPAKKAKKSKKKTVKHTAKKHSGKKKVAKKAAPAKAYCYPEPRVKPDDLVKDAPKQSPVPPTDLPPVKLPETTP